MENLEALITLLMYEMMNSMSEFINRANYGLKLGNFELDFGDGEIRFKVHVMCKDIVPSKSIVKRSIYCPATMFDRYGEGIVGIIFGVMSSKEAIEKCEGDREDQIRRLVTDLMDEEDCDDVNTMLARLSERLGLDEDENDESDDGSDNDTDVCMDLFCEEGEDA